MHRRRAALLALAMLLAAPLAPAQAASPFAPSDPAPLVDPSSTPEPSATPAPAGTPAAPGTPDPSPDPLDPSPPTGEPTPAAEPPSDTAQSPDTAASPKPSVVTGPGKGKANGGIDATGRFIVMLRGNADVPKATSKARGLGVAVDRTFSRAARGFSASLSAHQLAALRADPDVLAVVPDEIIELTAQYTPMGIRRIGGLRAPVARIDGVDTRVDADVAIVDTGIDASHPDLNVAGGYNCSTSDRTLWRDANNHGTHVAGTIGAIDNGSGVVGVAPGVRLWAVKILNDDGNGLLSWYVCGLDWIAAQRDPKDASRPLFEAVNMSVKKDGSDDGACGTRNADVLHAAICRLVASGVTVVAAAANDSRNASTAVPAAYDEVITVSALADSDGRPGGLGGSLCYSWGTYDVDDTFADFSNYGPDVDIIAPGKCIWSTLPGNRYGYSSGTSMAAPHVTGAVALYKASRPGATPAEVKQALLTLGSMDWDTTSDPDPYHEPLLDVSRIVTLGDYAVETPGSVGSVPEGGGAVAIPVTLLRSEGFFEAVQLAATVPKGFAAALSTSDLTGAGANDATVTVTVPRSTPAGSYSVVVAAHSWDRVRTAVATITVLGDAPVAAVPLIVASTGSIFGTSTLAARAIWAPATDATSPIGGYQVQWSIDGGAWTSAVSLPATTRASSRTMVAGHSYAARIRARDAAGNWSGWTATTPYRFTAIQDTSTAMKRSGTWYRYTSSAMSGGTALYSRSRGASVTTSVTGRGFALVMPKGSFRGQARIYIDGTLAATVSLYRSTSLSRQVILSRGYATTQTHTVKVVVVGTSGRPRIDVDAIVVLR